MAIDEQKEMLLSPSDAAAAVPPISGRGIHRATVVRWITRGALAKDGTRVYLEHVRHGRKLATSREALSRFFASLSAKTSEPAGPSHATIISGRFSQRRQQLQEATDKVRDMGIGRAQQQRRRLSAEPALAGLQAAQR